MATSIVNESDIKTTQDATFDVEAFLASMTLPVEKTKRKVSGVGKLTRLIKSVRSQKKIYDAQRTKMKDTRKKIESMLQEIELLKKEHLTI